MTLNLDDIRSTLEEMEFETPDYTCVSIYTKSQHYGGPEEGGWWYDRWHLEYYKTCPTEEEAVRVQEILTAKIQHLHDEYEKDKHRRTAEMPEGNSPYLDTEGYIPTGWADGADWVVIKESRPGANDNSREPRPHYE